MSTPATRRSERKRAPNPRIADLDSSPTQRAPPASKKRKASSQAAPRAPPRKRTPEVEVSDVSEASNDETAIDDDDEDDDDEDTADLIIPYLKMAPESVTVAQEYPNHKTEERYGRGNVNAFAKICGRNWTYYVLSPQIFFGRPSDAIHARQPREETTAQESVDDLPPIHIDLGPSRAVSRTHAELRYNQSDNRWHIQAHGRNGMKVDDANLRKGQNTKIRSGTIITIAGTEMVFQSATGKTEVHPSFIKRILDYQYQQYRRRPNISEQTTIAAGPSELARPVTPEPSPPKPPATGSAKKRSPNTHLRGGIMMESTEQIDYALDSSKDLKPGCSYASMITWAIISTDEQALSLNGIYTWIKAHYAYYRLATSGWQNSIRHNLSLNQAFDKVPRGPDEPGKGMKWCLVPEHRAATLLLAQKNASKGGGRVSSQPGTPAGGPRTGGFLPPPPNGMKTCPTDRSTPPLSSYPPAQQESYTPTRGPQMPIYAPTQGGLPVLSDETSPMPRRRPNGHLTAVDSSPTLTSGAWAHDAPMMRTPAPRPHNLNMPQPNTVKLPTSHLADSSPAPFWRFENMGSTPAGPWPEISPMKNGSGGVGAMQSSSPPPVANGAESPTRRARPPVGPYGPTAYGGNGIKDDEDGEIDITRGFTKISSYHQQRSNIASNGIHS